MESGDVVLVTGGVGYIGSNVCVKLINSGVRVVVIDNESRGIKENLADIGRITGITPLYEHCDVRDTERVYRVLREYGVESVIHLAGLKNPLESIEIPEEYYDNNINGSMSLLEAMKNAGVHKLLFSSTAAVYDKYAEMPVSEESRVDPATPYAVSKYQVEQMLKNEVDINQEMNVVVLRYFNPVGAHPSGALGDRLIEAATNLMPQIAMSVIDNTSKLKIYGDDYPTRDGTGVRDYIHVADLSTAHIAALDVLDRSEGFALYNIGTGEGYTVKEMISAFESATGRRVNYEIVGRRVGDVAISYADCTRSVKDLNWRPEKGLAEMCHDAWKFSESSVIQ